MTMKPPPRRPTGGSSKPTVVKPNVGKPGWVKPLVMASGLGMNPTATPKPKPTVGGQHTTGGPGGVRTKPTKAPGMRRGMGAGARSGVGRLGKRFTP